MARESSKHINTLIKRPKSFGGGGNCTLADLRGYVYRMYLRFEIVTAVKMSTMVLRVAMSCILVGNRLLTFQRNILHSSSGLK
jgi:hypothetical protein